MGDVNAFGPEFARCALRKAAQGELAHRESRRIGKAFDASGRAGEQDRAAPAWGHPLGRLLSDEKSAEGGNRQRPLDGRRIKLSERTGRAGAGVVDDDARLADLVVRGLE